MADHAQRRHGAADVEINALNKNPCIVCLLYRPSFLISHYLIISSDSFFSSSYHNFFLSVSSFVAFHAVRPTQIYSISFALSGY